MNEMPRMIAMAKLFGGGSGAPASPAQTVILPETEAQDIEGTPSILTPLAAPMVVGNTYKVTYNGVEYVCPALDASAMMPGVIILGNADVMGVPGGNADAPFALAIVPSGMPLPTGEVAYIQIMVFDDTTSVTLSIVEEAAPDNGNSDFVLRVVEVNGVTTSTQKWSEIVSAFSAGKRVRMIIGIGGIEYESYLFCSMKNGGTPMGLYFFTAGLMTNELTRYAVEPADDDGIGVRLMN